MSGPRPEAELVEVVDHDGAVLRIVTRAEVRAARLLHRSVFVAVTTGDRNLVVHQRAAWKDVWPSRWDLAFGGVVGAGESWETAACRELAEEAGISVDAAALVPLGPGAYADDAVDEVTFAFAVTHDGRLSCPDGEVVALDVVPLDELDGWLSTHDVVPDSVAVVLPYLRGDS